MIQVALPRLWCASVKILSLKGAFIAEKNFLLAILYVFYFAVHRKE